MSTNDIKCSSTFNYVRIYSQICVKKYNEMYKRRYLEKCNSGFLKNNLIIKWRGNWNLDVFVIKTKKKLVKIQVS